MLTLAMKGTSKARIIHQIQLIRGITHDNEDNEC
ncbi:Transposase [Shigella dysenteriae 1617]|uniref:Transposase n=1 Tax=Shigella dysenteriae 1617 TaxID=754093 RepID=A0A0A7A1I0_SHIDY|nr:Transposase [Shigella dysenteriae 1617]